MRRQMMIRQTFLRGPPARPLPRYPLESIIIIPCAFRYFHILMIWLRIGVRIRVFEEIAVYIAKVDEFDVWRDSTKVERGDFDRTDEGWSLSRRQLSVKDVNECGC
jgi:hypothetical protein